MRYYIVAGEASGDLHGANLMRGLYSEDPGADIRFWGGGAMESVYREHQHGNGLVQDYREGAIIGFWEVLVHSRSLLRKIRFCKEDILAWKPDVVILIDYPGFNFKIAEFSHKAGIKVYYYIAPKVWASREGRIRKLKAWVDKLYIVFPFEIPYFKAKDVPFVYKGNPLVDAVDRSGILTERREDFFRRHSLPGVLYIALLAGSRSGEIRSMMPVLMRFTDALHKIPQYSDYHFIIAAAPGRSKEDYPIGERDAFVHIVAGDTYSVLRHSEAAVINSGTASLEAALLGTPQAVGYRTARTTYLIMRNILKIKYISLANLIIDRPAFKEYLQDYLRADILLGEMRRLLEDSSYRKRMLEDYDEIREKLGGSGASRAVARSMIRSLAGLPDD